MIKDNSLFTICVLALLGSGCTVGPDYHQQSMSSLKVPEQYQAKASAAPTENISGWWKNFNDPSLTDLIIKALAANPNIDVAGARLRQARASFKETQSNLLPTVSASGSASGNETVTGTSTTASPGGQTSYSASIDASYEIDLFGGISRSVEAARADQQNAEANLHSAQLSVAAEMATNYVALRNAQVRLGIAKANLASQDDTLQITGWRLKAGLVSALDQQQAKAQREQTAASIPTLESNIVSAANRIAILLGEAPGAVNNLVENAQPMPHAPAVIDVGLPAELLNRRPDLVAAERNFAAATARIGVAEKDLYPALKLTGSLTGSGSSLSDLTNNIIGTLASTITAPIFQGERIRAAVDSAKGGADVAFGTYRAAVLSALEDVENALTNVRITRTRETRLIEAEAASKTARLYAASQYRAGSIDFQKLLDVERTLLSSQDARASATADRVTAAIQLYKALGGGWQNAPLPDTAHLTRARL